MAPEMFLNQPYTVDRLDALGGTEPGQSGNNSVHTDILPRRTLSLVPDVGLVILKTGMSRPKHPVQTTCRGWNASTETREAEIPSFEIIRNITLTIFGSRVLMQYDPLMMDRHFLPTIGYVADTMSAVSPPTASSESNTHAIHITESSPSAAVLSQNSQSTMDDLVDYEEYARGLPQDESLVSIPEGVTYNSISG